MIVVDTNIVVYAVIQSPQTLLVRQVAARDPEWILPPLWRYEFTSAVTTMVRGRALTEAQAEAAIVEAERLVAGRETAVDQVAAFRAAITFNLSAYDGQYVVLAQALGTKCVTTDARMIRKAPMVVITPADFLAVPPVP